jgi:UDP-N-acetylmuramate dehydrogenase
MAEALARALREAMPSLEIRQEEPMREHTSFRIGGPAEVLLLPGSAEELEETCRLLRHWGEKPLVLGNGTNVLAPDEGIRGVVILTKKAGAMSVSGGALTADCGALLTRLSALAGERALAGLEFAYGIPGTLGGALTMNAGAYGGEMKDVTARVDYLDGELRPCSASGEALGFGYRRSRFGPEDVILRARLTLREGDAGAIREKCRELTEKRRSSQPLDLPSAGSAFKRPEGAYAAALIDEAGLKGFRVGDAQVSEKHAGFVVNRGSATASDVKRLLELVRERVYERSGILLEPEVRML